MRCSLLTLSCYLDSELDARQQGEMEAHLVGCPRCRAGLSHLREEVERVGGLARVRVPDRSARSMLELLGLIAPGGELPPRSAQLPDAPPSDLPWLGAQAGQALPWTAPPKVPRGAHASARTPGVGRQAPVADEPHVLTAPAAAPGRTAAEEAAREEADVALMAPGEASPAPPVISVHPAPPPGPAAKRPRSRVEVASEPAAPAAPVATPPDPRPDTPAIGAPASEEAPESLTDSVTDAEPEQPSAETPAAENEQEPPADAPNDLEDALPPHPEPPAAAAPQPEAPPRAPAGPYFVGSAMARRAQVASRSTERPRPSAQPDALALQMLLSEQIAMATMPARSAVQPPPPAPPSLPPGETPVAVSLPETPDVPSPTAHDRAGVDAAVQDADPTAIEAVDQEGPLPAPRPSLFERFREKLAVRRALSGQTAADLDDSVEVVSGLGAPLRRGSSRADLARRRNEALRPAAPQGPQPISTRELRAGEMLAPAAHPSESRAPTALSGTPVDPFGRSPHPVSTFPGRQRDVSALPAPSRSVPPPPSAGAPPRTTPTPAATGFAPFGQARVLHEETRIGGAAPPPSAPARSPVPLLPPPIPPSAGGPDAPVKQGPSPSELREGRRLLVLYIGAVALLFIIGMVSARTTSPIPTSSTTSSSTSSSSASTSSTSAAQQPAAQTAPTHAAPAPAGPATPPAAQHPTAPPPAAPQTVGAGGTGWQIHAFRFGDHGTYYLVVMDLTGSGALPTVSVANQDAQTVMLTVAGTAAATSPTVPPPGGWVSHVSLVTPSPTPGAAVYRITLSKPGTAKLTTLTSPSRIVVEIH